MQTKTMYVAEGCMTFIRSMINQHHADKRELYETLTKLCQKEADRLASIDPLRNR